MRVNLPYIRSFGEYCVLETSTKKGAGSVLIGLPCWGVMSPQARVGAPVLYDHVVSRNNPTRNTTRTCMDFSIVCLGFF